MLLRVRATAFLSGAAIAGAFAVFKLRQDLLDSQEVLLKQVSRPGNPAALLQEACAAG